MSLTHAQTASLAILSIATITAFLIAIHAYSTELASIWTRQCSSSARHQFILLASRGNGGDIGSIASTVSRLVCFAVSFFQIALASTRGKLEEAVIIAFLAGLASITATESARTRRRRTIPTTTLKSTPLTGQEPRQDGKDTTDGSILSSREVENQDNNRIIKETSDNPILENVGVQTKENDELVDDASPMRLSQATIHNLTIPWLLYNLLMGAVAWQAIIVPAFLREEQQQQQQRRRRQLWRQKTRRDESRPLGSFAIAVSIIVGLLLPATLMLTSPRSELAVLAFLVFPIGITLVQNLINALFGSKPRLRASQHESDLLSSSSRRGSTTWLVYAIPIIYSLAAHILLLHNLWLTFHHSSSPLKQQQQQEEEASHQQIAELGTRTSTGALLLLEIDHIAIFLTVLFWIYNTEAGGISAVCVMVLSSFLAGPGAGVCAGWLYRDRTLVLEQRRQTRNIDGSCSGSDRSNDNNSNNTSLAKNKRETLKRRASGKATTGHWFGGPDFGA